MAADSPSKTSKVESFMTSDLSGELSFLVARMRAIGSTRANDALKPLELKVRSYSVLSLACEKVPPTQRDLADFLTLDPSQIVPLVDDLEKRGLVTRMASPTDRRSKVVIATEDGRNLYVRARRVTAHSEAETLSNLNEEERTQLRELLSRVALRPF
ncbi:MarR family transcriptional regulator [Glutamicibacter sp. V16R2B1]|uniref:MarR family winged helix-turn-helix transcriptional regulator n=1 Tax=Glutamicibacter sp. V16R2B1 TaxID=2036207 RepID=UPI0010FDF1D3|nr:MarR family transcriptional regulator [Glutamicibacter sp. V16R2B1]TLK54028.1 MarR family transcriptional regulator [Glutamicibacter sp. V16R2B1]